MRQAEKERKKFQTRIPFILDPGKEIPKKIAKKKSKNEKTYFRHYFLPKWDEIGGEREKKNYTPEFCSYPTRARKFEIKNSKKLQKIKKVNFDIILSKTGWERARMRKKKIDS